MIKRLSAKFISFSLSKSLAKFRITVNITELSYLKETLQILA